MTRDEAIALAHTVMRAISRPELGVAIDHRLLTIVKITRNQQVRYAATDRVWIRFHTRIGSDQAVEVQTNVREPDHLQAIVRRAEQEATPLLRPEDRNDDADDPMHLSHRPRTYLPVSLWSDTVPTAVSTVLGDTVARLVALLRKTPFQCAATIALMSRGRLRIFPEGMTAWGEDTDSELSVSARASDGSASGWSGATNRDWTKIHPERVVEAAIDMARRNMGAVRVEPGRYTAILGPSAVMSLVAKMGPLFNAESPGPWLKTKLGERVMDPRITMSSDPNDPEGGDFPFFESDGYPSGAKTWVEHGILRARSYYVGTAMLRGVTPIKDPDAIRMTGGTASIEDMIRRCARGIYVHRFSPVEVIDSPSGAMIGTTRDGCFLIKDGAIKTPIKNLRFYDSPFLRFNQVLELGVPERAAIGFLPPDRMLGYQDTMDQWPHPPIIVPPMMVQDFNFSALSDAV